MILSSALLCMALNVYYEARGEPISGQMAVAHVTWTRAKHDQTQICKVVVKAKQFSWTADKLKRNKAGRYVLVGGIPKDKAAWESALFVAKFAILSGGRFDPTYGATHFHAHYVSPEWRKSMRKVRVVGNHIFYKQI